MKNFVQRLFFFILPIIVLGAGAEYVSRKIPNDYSYKNGYLYNNSQSIEVLVLGSSHSFYGVNPVYFSRKAFNAAYLSQSLKYDYCIFDKYKNKLSNLKIIVLPISYGTLFSQLEDDIEHWRAKSYSIYYGCKYHYGLQDNYEVIGAKPISVLRNIYRYMQGGDDVTASELGFGLKYSHVKQSDLSATGLAAAERHTYEDLGSLGTNLDFLQQIITESRKIGVEVLLFTPPARKSYISNLDQRQLSIMEASLAEIILKNPDVEYVDFMSDARFIDADFKDADHLNGIGAKKLTQLIDRIVLEKTNLADIKSSQ